MQTPVCEQVRAWISEQRRSAPSVPPPELVSHVASCPLCRGALLTLTVALLPALVDPLAEASCNDCQEALDAFIDREYAIGVDSAREAYPQIWWHLWTCMNCAEAYELTRAMANAQRRGLIAPLPHPASYPQPYAILRPSAFLVKQVVSAQAQLGVSRGTDELGFAIAETNVDGRAIHLYLLLSSDVHCQITVTVEPPALGTATLVLGKDVYQADISKVGRAVFAGLLADRVVSTDSFDLTLLFDNPSLSVDA